MNKVAIYARVSTEDQLVDSQLFALYEYCQNRGIEVYKTYIDKGYSGAARSRPQLDCLMADSRRRKFNAVVVYRFDRFARSTKHLLSALEEFKALKISFISLTESIDTSTPLGEALFTILSAIGQLERDIIRERVRSGLRAAQAKGKVLGRPKKTNDPLIEILRSEGLSIRQIARKRGLSPSAVQRALGVSKTLSQAFKKAE